MKISFAYISVFLLFALLSCKSQVDLAEDTPQTRAKEAAKELCACGQSIAPLLEKIETAAAADDQATLKTLSPAYQTQKGSFDDCLGETHGRYPDISKNGDDDEEIQATLATECPKTLLLIYGDYRVMLGGGYDTTQPTLKQGDYETIARTACDCMRPIATLIRERKTLLDKGDEEALTSLSGKMDTANEEMANCLNALEQRYPSAEGNRADERAAKAAVRGLCPELLGMAQN